MRTDDVRTVAFLAEDVATEEAPETQRRIIG